MQVRLWSDWLSRMCALSLGPLPSLSNCYCGDWGLWVTNGRWVTSAIVSGTRRVNPSYEYKELKGCTHGQGKREPQHVQKLELSPDHLYAFRKMSVHPLSIHPSIHSHLNWRVLNWPNEHVCVWDETGGDGNPPHTYSIEETIKINSKIPDPSYCCASLLPLINFEHTYWNASQGYSE